MKIENCPICNRKSSDNKEVFGGGFKYLQCRDCYVFYQCNYMSRDEAKEYYEKSYRQDGVTSKEIYAKRLVKTLRKGIKEIEFPLEGSMLEIGSDAGGTVFYLKEKGYKIESTEICSEYAKRIEKVGIKVYNDIFENIVFDKKYDCIIALEVLEHFTNPKFCINKIYSLLNDNGYFIFQTPIMTLDLLISKNFNDFSVPHFCVFTVESLKYLLLPLFSFPEITPGSGIVYRVQKLGA